jgi:hypothetical protein
MGRASSVTGRTDETNGSPNRRVAELENEIALTRAEMTGTVQAIEQKLNPRVLKEEALEQFHELKRSIRAELREDVDAAKRAAHDATIGKVETMIQSIESTTMNAGSRIAATVRENPVPAALVCVGLGWLVFASRSNRGEARATSAESVRMKANEAMKGAAEKVEDLKESVREKAGELSSRASDVVESAETVAMRAGQTTVERAADVAAKARAATGRIQVNARRLYDENPLVFGAAALAAGAIVGATVPITHKEDEWLGQARDEALNRLGDYVHGAIERVGDKGSDPLVRTDIGKPTPG